MKRWLGRVRGTLGMGLIWALGGAGVGGVIELVDNVFPGSFAFISRVDMWPQTLAIPAFLGGVIFSIVLMVAAGRQRLDELSMSRFVACGAVTGVLLGGIGMSFGAPLLFMGITAMAGMIGASCSLVLARLATRKERLGARADVLEIGDAEGEPHRQIGQSD